MAPTQTTSQTEHALDSIMTRWWVIYAKRAVDTITVFQWTSNIMMPCTQKSSSMTLESGHFAALMTFPNHMLISMESTCILSNHLHAALFAK